VALAAFAAATAPYNAIVAGVAVVIGPNRRVGQPLHAPDCRAGTAHYKRVPRLVRGVYDAA